MQNVYLDNAATTRIRPSVIEKMQDCLVNHYGNPSSTHAFGRPAKTAVEKARKSIAKILNAHPSEIIFTSGGTEADNMILRGAVRDLGVETIITSPIEHHAVLHTTEELAKDYGVRIEYVDLDEGGNPQLAHLEQLIKQNGSRKLVSLMHINNEIGNKIDIQSADNRQRRHQPGRHPQYPCAKPALKTRQPRFVRLFDQVQAGIVHLDDAGDEAVDTHRNGGREEGQHRYSGCQVCFLHRAKDDNDNLR